jgi:hypothetical protein
VSRAYRIHVRESLCKVIRAEDHVSTQLELLPILAPEQMAELLAAELASRGFVMEGDVLQRDEAGVMVTVEPATARVTVQAVAEGEADLSAESVGYAVRDDAVSAQRVNDALRKELKKTLKEKAKQNKAVLQAAVSADLEKHLAGLSKELNTVVNRVTAEALKRKAAQLGAIKQVTEDLQTGSMTIVLEV